MSSEAAQYVNGHLSNVVVGLVVGSIEGEPRLGATQLSRLLHSPSIRMSRVRAQQSCDRSLHRPSLRHLYGELAHSTAIVT